ncbi:hypothetical protein [Pedobacter cryophilus]|uniref:DUF4382 domain-containing protein n=1 Tax=Pedobacter cryophilus TaxID=2571271 RepID=A0A4U1C6J9_9SPHI|nr:hypothetical protein [Pedobacter cryophilus]TKB99000.1 hypothetical protein FA046_07765 [Pedobacter cryophilus]
MKSNFLKTSLILFGLGSILAACNKNDSVGGGGEVKYQVKPTGYSATVASSSSGSGLVAVVGSSNSLNFTSGFLNVNEVDFEAENKTVEIEYELKGISNVDLFNLSPILGSVQIPEGTYDEVELKLVLKKSTDNTIPLTLKGIYKNEAGITTPVEFYFNEDYEIEVEAEDVVINSNSDYLGLINLQLNKLLLNVAANDLSLATKTNNTIIISSTSNVNLYNKFKANLNAFGDCDFED